MSHPLPRYLAHDQLAWERKRDRILREVGADQPDTDTRTYATAGGDERKLRGIPAIGRNVAGAIPGTSPHRIR